MPFSEQFLQELADKNDIVDVVGAYVPLKFKSGSYWACCPFHNEKTPSFHVMADRQAFHCFGCGKGGSVFQFIMDMETLSFSEAVAFLAKRAGVELPENGNPEERYRRERLLALCRDVARFYFTALTSPSGRPGQEYVLRRRLSMNMVKSFGLGYAADDWHTVSHAMSAKGYTEEELITAGLAKQNRKGNGIYDVFRNRLMFPVIDPQGNVIGFSGRILGDGEPKYLNSRETPIFHKSKSLFALNRAKKSKSGYILLTEGNIDVVSLHQAGFDSAVASLGTSLTPDQAQLIMRYAKEVIIAYDNDGAGQKAAQRAIKILENLNLKVKVLRMEGAKDPDEFIKTKGAEAFRRLLEGSENHVEYRLRMAQRNLDMDTDEGKVTYLKTAAEMIAALESPVEREVYTLRLGEDVGVSKDVVANEVQQIRRRALSGERKRAERDAVRFARTAAQPKAHSLHGENGRSALAEEGIIRLLWLEPSLRKYADISPEEFSNPVLARLYRILLDKIEQNLPVSFASLSSTFPDGEIGYISGFLNQPETLANGRQAMADYIDAIRMERSSPADPADPTDLLAFAARQRNKKAYKADKGMVDYNG